MPPMTTRRPPSSLHWSHARRSVYPGISCTRATRSRSPRRPRRNRNPAPHNRGPTSLAPRPPSPYAHTCVIVRILLIQGPAAPHPIDACAGAPRDLIDSRGRVCTPAFNFLAPVTAHYIQSDYTKILEGGAVASQYRGNYGCLPIWSFRNEGSRIDPMTRIVLVEILDWPKVDWKPLRVHVGYISSLYSVLESPATMTNNHIVNEETALLAPAKKLQKPTPLPKVQIGIVLLLQLCEPITSQSIYPYINQLISELDITGGDERKVGYYAGLIQSLFYLSETIMVMQWSRISDHIGRKPIILIGLVGTSASILLFGLSRTFWTLVLSRCLCGLLNGNIGVIKSVMGELTDPSNRAQGFSLIPAASAAGATLGPLVGGTFARPREQFPRVFGGQFWQDYPYFLPCLVASSFVCVSFIIGLLFLKETAPKRVIDRGRFPLASGGVTPADAPPVCSHSEVLPLRDLLVRPVVISISNYMALAFLDIMLNALLPLFFAMPIHIGGLGFKPSTIGYIMGLYGLGNGVFQTLFFSRIVQRFGERHVFLGGIMLFMPMFLLFPVMSLIARRSGVNFAVKLIIALLLSLMGFMEMAFGCIFIYVMASSPNKHSLGATNGLSQMSVSLIRAVGPALATSLFSLSVEKNVLGGYAVYAVLFCIPCLAIFLAVLLPEKVWEEKDDDDVKPSD